METERLEMGEQPIAELVHHLLAGADLHLGRNRGHELIHHFERGARDDKQNEEGDRAGADQRHRPVPERFRQRIAVQYVVDDDLERPGLQRAEGNLHQQQHDHQHHASAVWTEKAQRPGHQRWHRRRPSLRDAHPIAFLGSTAGSGGFARTRFGAIFGRFRATT